MKKLSIIYAVRNDNYNGNFYYRFYTSLIFLEEAIKLNKLKNKVEIIVVDWNSKVSFNLKKDFPKNITKNIKLIIVNPSILLKKKIKSKFNVTQAVNTGIRRAKGNYVLNINSDILITETFLSKLFELINKGKLKNKFFQISRKFIPSIITEVQLNEIDLRKYIKFFSRYLNEGGKVAGLMSGAGGFLAERKTWHDISGFSEKFSGHGWTDIELGIKLKSVCDLETGDYYGLYLYDLQQSLDSKNNLNTYPFLITKNNKNWGLNKEKLKISNNQNSSKNFKKKFVKYKINKKNISYITFLKSYLLTENLKIIEIKDILNHIYFNDHYIVNFFVFDKSFEYVEFLSRYYKNSIISYFLDRKKIKNFEKKYLKLHFNNFFTNRGNLVEYHPLNKFNKISKKIYFKEIIPNYSLKNNRKKNEYNVLLALFTILIYLIFPLKWLLDLKSFPKKLFKLFKLLK